MDRRRAKDEHFLIPLSTIVTACAAPRSRNSGKPARHRLNEAMPTARMDESK